jgi:YD repeat-containing protein
MLYTRPRDDSLLRIAPLILKSRAAAFDNPDWLYEIKYDAFRALLEINDPGARLLSRNGNRFRHLDPLAAALAKCLRVNDAILDGEVMCVDETGRLIFLDLLPTERAVLRRLRSSLTQWRGFSPIAPHRAQGPAQAAATASLQSSHCRSAICLSGAELALDRLDQLIGTNGLQQHVVLREAFLWELKGISRDDQGLDAPRGRCVRNVEAVAVGQDHVGQHEVVETFAEECLCFGHATHPMDPEAALQERVLQQRADVRVIFDQ